MAWASGCESLIDVEKVDIIALKETLRRELPELLREDPRLREFLLELTRREHPSRAETDDRFYELLGELGRDREEQNRKWEANQVELRRLHEKIMAQAQKHERSVGALGSRWGLESDGSSLAWQAKKFLQPTEII